MNIRISLFLILFFVVFNDVKSADWKYIGYNKKEGINYYDFYDVKTKERKPNGNIVIWIKSISEQKMDSIATENQDTLNNLVLKKVKQQYLPPYAVILQDTSSMDALLFVIRVEIIVKLYITTKSYVSHVEFDNKNRKMRTLSIISYDEFGNVKETVTKPLEWIEIIPESYGDDILRVLYQKY